MKVAFLNIFQGGTHRGLETYVSELSERLGKNHSVDIIGSKAKSFQRWPFLWRLYLDPHGLAILYFTLKCLPKIWKEKYDFVFALNGGWQPAFIRIVTWLYGGKMIRSGQSGKGWDDRFNLWCFPDSFIALSSDSKKWAREVNPYVATYYVPNGVDLGKFKPEGEKY